MTDDRILRLLVQIDAEAYGRCRPWRIADLSRRARLEIKKSQRKNRKTRTT